MRKMRAVWLAAVFLLAGCRGAETSGYGEDMKKAQKIEVIAAGEAEAVRTVEAEEEIADFVEGLGVESWRMAALPQGAEEIGRFELSQEETLKLGQEEGGGLLERTAAITLYEGEYIRFETGGLNMDFQVSEAAAGFMGGYFVP